MVHCREDISKAAVSIVCDILLKKDFFKFKMVTN